MISGVMDRSVTERTKDLMWSAILWSLSSLLHGVHPSRRHDGEDLDTDAERDSAGEPLRGPYFFVIWQFRADQDYHSNHLGMTHFSQNCPCLWCQCNVFDTDEDIRCAIWGCRSVPWNDWAATARWIATSWSSHGEWMEEMGGPMHVHPYFLLIGVTVFTLMCDSLHIFELGVTHRVLGNVIYHLVFTPGMLTGDSPEARLEDFNDRLGRIYGQMGSQNKVHKVTLSMFCNASSPSLSQPELSSRVKAAESRSMVPIMQRLFDEIKRDVDEDKTISKLLAALNGYYKVLLHYDDYTLPAGPQHRLETAVWNVVRGYGTMCRWARDRTLRRWGGR